jgi:hypothetical protein
MGGLEQGYRLGGQREMPHQWADRQNDRVLWTKRIASLGAVFREELDPGTRTSQSLTKQVWSSLNPVLEPLQIDHEHPVKRIV